MVICLLQNVIGDLYLASLAQLLAYSSKTGLVMKASITSAKLPNLTEVIMNLAFDQVRQVIINQYVEYHQIIQGTDFIEQF